MIYDKCPSRLQKKITEPMKVMQQQVHMYMTVDPWWASFRVYLLALTCINRLCLAVCEWSVVSLVSRPNPLTRRNGLVNEVSV